MIDVKGLVKTFGTTRAVNNISFSVPKGQILGFLGPNGAGKSTTMKMLTGFISPSSGTATIAGKDVTKEPLEVKKLIGYLPESAPSYGEMTACEFLTFIAEMRGLRGAQAHEAALKMKEVCFLKGVWHQPIETLSKGYRQRVGFAQALIHDPPVLILDEPTDGLDPNQKYEVRELIRRMGRDKTIILSTHILEEVEAICERVIIIAGGAIVSDATPNELLGKTRIHNAVTVRFVQEAPSGAKATLAHLEGISDIEEVSGPFPGLRCYPKQDRPILEPVAQTIKDQGWQVVQLRSEQGRLDEVFRKVTLGR